MEKELQKRILSSIIIIPLSFFFIIKGSILFTSFIIIILLVTSYEWYMMRKNQSYHYIGYFFLFFSFYTVYSIRNNFGDDGENLIFFLFILLICISTDIGGYIIGKIFKGPKLIKVSPNKTYAGMFGGYLFSFITIFFLFEYSEIFFDTNTKLLPKIYLHIIVISTVSQIGDIIISYFKRLSKIKDTGKIIPGHGGILDRIDGMIFAFPFTYVVYSLNILES
tara:strand:- start:4022 stop:4687 length:666 start_codon:yes stop_codon:yes gene_type:complete